jgi:hypothetical protein
LTEKEESAYQRFAEVCEEIYNKFSPHKISDRMNQIKSSPAITATLNFMIMVYDLLSIHGVMKFNKNVTPDLYRHMNDIQEQTGRKLVLMRLLLDGVKATKMELLSGVTVHPLPDFREPEYKTMASKTPAPVDPDEEEFEERDPSEVQSEEPPDDSSNPWNAPQDPSAVPDDSSNQPQSVGPGGPFFDPDVVPESGTPVDPPVNPPDSIDELPDEP